jgi:hypothetical protein
LASGDLVELISRDNNNKWGSKLSKAKLRKIDSKLVSMLVVSAREKILTRTAIGTGGEVKLVEDEWIVEMTKKTKRKRRPISQSEL